MAASGQFYESSKAEAAHIIASDAQNRSHLLSSLTYKLTFFLAKGTRYACKAQISFLCKQENAPIWLDFTGEEIHYFAVNGLLQAPLYQHSKLHLPGLFLGQNTVSVHYVNRYGHDSTGFHHFTDVADGQEYLFTQFEAAYAHTVFPCFDQPDLKAVLELCVIAPQEWRVIGNEPAISSNWTRNEGLLEAIMGESVCKQHNFQPTKPISTYLYAICAGPYVEYRHDSNDLGIPLGIYCRQSLAQDCDYERYFRWTLQGLHFYNEFFGVPYPFAKYDQVLVPEFESCAMENVGCVVYTDDYIYSDQPSAVMLADAADSFLHEMAHMWFGNLVTMQWWDDLWLNESFATYISQVCRSSYLSAEFPHIWNDFLSLKAWGYSTDQLVTTHPISLRVENTGETETNFDGISYSKGSSVLKQLHFILGDEVFRSAIREYIQRNQYGNTVFDDLISVISKHAKMANLGINIEEWAETWVKTAGLNQLQACFQAENGKITHFSILQSAVLPAHPTLRPHKLILELYGPHMSLIWNGPVHIHPQSETFFPQFTGLPAPICVLLNAEDHAFAKIMLDPVSLDYLQTHIYSIPCSLTKQVTIQAIWDMVRDCKYVSIDFVALVIKGIKQEKDIVICNYLLDLGNQAIEDYLPMGMAQEQWAGRVFKAVIERMRRTKTQEEVLILQDQLWGLLWHPRDIIAAKNWVLAGTTGIPYFKLGQTDRWMVLEAYATISELAKDLVSEELQRDNTSTGQNSALKCQGSYPDPCSKHSTYQKLTTQTSNFSNFQLQSLAQGFNCSRHTWLSTPYLSLYSQTVLGLIGTVDRELSRIVAEYLLPKYAEEEEVIGVIGELLREVPEERVDIVRELREQRDELGRRLKCRELAAKRIYE